MCWNQFQTVSGLSSVLQGGAAVFGHMTLCCALWHPQPRGALWLCGWHICLVALGCSVWIPTRMPSAWNSCVPPVRGLPHGADSTRIPAEHPPGWLIHVYSTYAQHSLLSSMDGCMYSDPLSIYTRVPSNPLEGWGTDHHPSVFSRSDLKFVGCKRTHDHLHPSPMECLIGSAWQVWPDRSTHVKWAQVCGFSLNPLALQKHAGKLIESCLNCP